MAGTRHGQDAGQLWPWRRTTSARRHVVQKTDGAVKVQVQRWGCSTGGTRVAAATALHDKRAVQQGRRHNGWGADGAAKAQVQWLGCRWHSQSAGTMVGTWHRLDVGICSTVGKVVLQARADFHVRGDKEVVARGLVDRSCSAAQQCLQAS
jgi:hypothetical protein